MDRVDEIVSRLESMEVLLNEVVRNTRRKPREYKPRNRASKKMVALQVWLDHQYSIRGEDAIIYADVLEQGTVEIASKTTVHKFMKSKGYVAKKGKEGWYWEKW